MMVNRGSTDINRLRSRSSEHQPLLLVQHAAECEDLLLRLRHLGSLHGRGSPQCLLNGACCAPWKIGKDALAQQGRCAAQRHRKLLLRNVGQQRLDAAVFEFRNVLEGEHPLNETLGKLRVVLPDPLHRRCIHAFGERTENLGRRRYAAERRPMAEVSGGKRKQHFI